MADGDVFSDPTESGSRSGQESKSAATQIIFKNFDRDWYIRVKVECRSVTQFERLRFIADIGQKVITLFEGLKSRLTTFDIYMWPQRLVDSTDDDENTKMYTYYWLIGLPTIPSAELTKSRQFLREWLDNSNGAAPGNNQEAKKTIQAKFIPRKLLLEQDLREDSVSEVERGLKDGMSGSGEDFMVPASNTAEAESDLNNETPKSGKTFEKIPGSNPGQVRKQFLQHVMGQSKDEAKKIQSSVKLRPAKDVLNRLKHDSGYKSDEYVVGYIDRQAGILEKPLCLWEQYEQDELIAYFKHVPENLIVWDRARKIDWIFNTRPK